MSSELPSVSSIIEHVRGDAEYSVIEPFRFASEKKNQLLLLLKPETFAGNDDSVKGVVELVWQKLSEFGVNTAGTLQLGSGELKRLGLMEKHYSLINGYSRNAAAAGSPDAAAIAEAFGESIDGLEVVGAHDFLERHGDFVTQLIGDSGKTPGQALIQAWDAAPMIRKAASGFVVAKDPFGAAGGPRVVLVNGFFPSLLEHFQSPGRRLLVVLVESDTSWEPLRKELIGATNPEKAAAGSIRGTLFGDPERFGVSEAAGGQGVSSDRNYVHLSAGPFEGSFEVDNFLRGRDGVPFDFGATTLMALAAKKYGIGEAEIAGCFKNPKIQTAKGSELLFDATEELDTEPALDIYRAATA